MESLEDFLTSLTAFEAGGRGLAFAPTSSEKRIPAGASTIGGSLTAVNWFREKMDTAEPSMLFLVGAPGNGKSFLLDQLTAGLNRQGDHSRDQRRFSFSSDAGQSLVVINDASAPAEDGKSTGLLANDLHEAINERKFIHVNVNRGVLYQELRSNIQSDSIRSLIEWLSNPSKLSHSLPNLEIQDPNPHSSLRCGILSVPDGAGVREIPVVVVMMDFYSIFEKQPNHEMNSQGRWAGFPGLATNEKYRITGPNSQERKSREHWLLTPAGELLSETVAIGFSLLDGDHNPLDPIVANLQSLSNKEVYCGVLSALRNTELISSQHISFRELWTAVAALIIGDGDGRQSVEVAADKRLDPSGWVLAATESIPTELNEERVANLLRLASTRFSQSIFGALQSPVDVVVERGLSPLLKLTRMADPAIDARPNSIERTGQKGWASPVTDACRGQVGEASIVESLQEYAAERGVTFSYTSFDSEIDAMIRELISADYDDSPIIRRELLEHVLAWYGEYLLRLYALSIGQTAFEEEVEAWVSAWGTALTNNSLPTAARKAVLGLLVPTFKSSNSNENPHRLVSYLSARTEAITESTYRPQLAIEITETPYTRAHAYGDELVVDIRNEEGSKLLEFSLDFSLMREAMAVLDWPQAITELSAALTPRVERLRASLANMAPVQGNIRVVNGGQVEMVRIR
jgi:hypothetical protein